MKGYTTHRVSPSYTLFGGVRDRVQHFVYSALLRNATGRKPTDNGKQSEATVLIEQRIRMSIGKIMVNVNYYDDVTRLQCGQSAPRQDHPAAGGTTQREHRGTNAQAVDHE
jgi:hypothetical protein